MGNQRKTPEQVRILRLVSDNPYPSKQAKQLDFSFQEPENKYESDPKEIKKNIEAILASIAERDGRR